MVMTSIYIHIPFCKQRCIYCDFITYAGMEAYLPEYIQAICREVEILGKIHQGCDVISSIYFGGGTPSLVSENQIESILHSLRKWFLIKDEAEITIEANPGTLGGKNLHAFRELGINRLSLGAQSVDNACLKKLGRIHDVKDIYKSVDTAYSSGFENVSIDLIFNLPWQSLQEWKEDLQKAITLGTQHLSLYNLTLEPGTQLFNLVNSGIYPELNDELAADMYITGQEALASAGFVQYEISNWAKEGNFESEHNKNYWRNLPYIGIGAAAHSYIHDERLENFKTIPGYIKGISESQSKISSSESSPANISNLTLSKHEQMQDTMMLGLRMTREGVREDWFSERFDRKMSEIFQIQIRELLSSGLCEWGKIDNSRCFRLTSYGILFGNRAFRMFV
jgi:oxygen-independent coproporphyrinogen-3 oxidase